MSSSLTADEINASKLITSGPPQARSRSHWRSGNWPHALPSKSVEQRKSTTDAGKYRRRLTVKFVGARGGVLVTKRPLPQVAAVDGERTPVTASLHMDRRLEGVDERPGRREDDSRRRRLPSQSASCLLKPQEEEKYIVNRYSFPRRLVSVKKKHPVVEPIKLKSPGLIAFELRYELEKMKKLPTPRLRRGCSGWMLSSSKIEEQPLLHRIVRQKTNARASLDAANCISGDMYLEYLQQKATRPL